MGVLKRTEFTKKNKKIFCPSYWGVHTGASVLLGGVCGGCLRTKKKQKLDFKSATYSAYVMLVKILHYPDISVLFDEFVLSLEVLIANLLDSSAPLLPMSCWVGYFRSCSLLWTTTGLGQCAPLSRWKPFFWCRSSRRSKDVGTNLKKSCIFSHLH